MMVHGALAPLAPAIFAAGSPAGATASWVAIAAVVIAALALLSSTIIGFLNRRAAKRALELSERQEARRNTELDLYLIASAARRRVSTGDRVLEFQVQISNPSDRPSSVVAAELHVTYSVEGVVATTKVPSTSKEDEFATPKLPILELPARVEANHAVSGWLRFRLSGSLMQDRSPDRFDLAIRDVHGIEQSVQVRVIADVIP